MPTGTSQWGSVRWGASGAAIAGSGLVLDTLAAYNDALYRLGFSGARDIVSTSWVTETELFQWADEAAKRLSYEAGVFVTYDNSTNVLAGTAAYALPATHVFTVSAALLYVGWLQLLRITPVGALFALDAAWTAAPPGDPVRLSMDAGGPGTATLYPGPANNATLGLVAQEFPGTVSLGASTLPLPMVLQDYFSYVLLRGARLKESESRMEEMARHFDERIKLYDSIMKAYFGAGQ
jgi:hypothetical protein